MLKQKKTDMYLQLWMLGSTLTRWSQQFLYVGYNINIHILRVAICSF